MEIGISFTHQVPGYRVQGGHRGQCVHAARARPDAVRHARHAEPVCECRLLSLTWVSSADFPRLGSLESLLRLLFNIGQDAWHVQAADTFHLLCQFCAVEVTMEDACASICSLCFAGRHHQRPVRRPHRRPGPHALCQRRCAICAATCPAIAPVIRHRL